MLADFIVTIIEKMRESCKKKTITVLELVKS